MTTLYTLPGLPIQGHPYAYATPGHLLGLWGKMVKAITADFGPVGVARWILENISSPEVQAKIDAFVAEAKANGWPIQLDIEPMPNEKIEDWPRSHRDLYHAAMHKVLDNILSRWPSAMIYGYRTPYFRHDRRIRFELAKAAMEGKPLPPSRQDKQAYWASRYEVERDLLQQHKDVSREFALGDNDHRTVGIVDRLSGLLLHGYLSAGYPPDQWFDDYLDAAVRKQRPFCVLQSAYYGGSDKLAPVEHNQYVLEKTIAKGGSSMWFAKKQHHDDPLALPTYNMVNQLAGAA